jgi:hypothetical protein
MKRINALLIGALVVAAAALVYAGDNKSAPNHVGAFTLKKNVTLYWPDGTQESRREIYRRSSDGSFRIIETDGKVIFRDRGFWQGRGFLHVDYGKKTLWRDTTQTPDRGPDPIISPEVYAKDQFYAGTDTVLGRTAYTVKVPNDAGGVDVENWFLPELGRVPVRSLYYKGDGSLERTTEPYSLEFGEPDPTLMRPPDFPVVDHPQKK